MPERVAIGITSGYVSDVSAMKPTFASFTRHCLRGKFDALNDENCSPRTSLAAMSDLFFDCSLAITVASMLGLLVMDAFTQDEFLGFPRAEQKKSRLSSFLAVMREHGPVVPQTMAAEFLDVSRQRVHQFISEGRLVTVTVNGQRFIPVAALEFFVTEERKNGRPFKQPKFSQLMRAGLKKS